MGSAAAKTGKIPPLLWAMSARFFVIFSLQLQSVLLGWQMYNLTHNTLKLGLIGLSEAVPALSLALFAGHIVDRSYPVRLYRFLIIVIVASLFVAMNAKTENMLYAASFLTGVGRSFGAPAMNTIFPRIVDRFQLPRATALMTMMNRLGMVLGPVAAGFLYSWKGYAFSYGIGIIAVGVSFVSTAFLPWIEKAASKEKETLLGSMGDAIKYVFQNKLLFPALTLDMFAVLFGGVVAILPAIASDVLHVDSNGLGLLRAAPAVGAIFVTFFMAKMPIEEKAGKALLGSAIGFGICILIFAASRNFYLSCFVLLLSGMFDSVGMVIRATILQLTAPDVMRGRIAAINAMFLSSGNEIGAFESGVAASAMGLVPSIYFGGVMTLLTVAVVYRIYPAMGQLNLFKLKERRRVPRSEVRVAL